jgi:hypothetical protein
MMAGKRGALQAKEKAVWPGIPKSSVPNGRHQTVHLKAKNLAGIPPQWRKGGALEAAEKLGGPAALKGRS